MRFNRSPMAASSALIAVSVAMILAGVVPATSAADRLEWYEVDPGLFRTRSHPAAHAIVDAGHCVLIGAPASVTPTNLPGAARTCDLVLLTHHHRDTSSGAAAFVAAKIPVRASKLTEAYLQPEQVARYWEKSMPVVTPGRFPPLTERFWGDWTYLVHPTGIAGVQFDLGERELLAWQGWKILVLPTPGHSRDHTSFVATRPAVSPGGNDQVVCFSGDAITGNGRIWSPFTLEWHHQKDEGAVAAGVSLRAIASQKPTLVLPEHGEPLRGDVIQTALLETAERLAQLAAAKNYDAFTQSLGDVPEYSFLAPDQVGTANAQGNPVPWTKLSPHLFLSGNTYALASQDGPVLLMDPYSQNIGVRVDELKRDHGFGPVEGVMISHAHNDHYTGIFALPQRSSYQVWTLKQVAQVVDAPHRFLAPYVDARIPKVDRTFADGEVIRWHEYSLRFHHLPGQTTFAMGVEVTVDGKRCLFTGDNVFHHSQYSGSGGWSGRNRGLPDGYLKSMEKILTLRPDWILAEHGGAFEFNARDFERRRDFARRAIEVADRISPHGNHRLDWDPQRIRLEPLNSSVQAGGTKRLKLHVDNPTADSITYTIRPGHSGFTDGREWKVVAIPNATTSIDIDLTIPPGTVPGRIVLPFLVESNNELDGADTFAVLHVESTSSPTPNSP